MRSVAIGELRPRKEELQNSDPKSWMIDFSSGKVLYFQKLLITLIKRHLINMDFTFREHYRDLNDRQLIERITTPPHEEEAAVYLIYEKYSPKFRKLCRQIYGDMEWYEDCLADLYDYLRGTDEHWYKLTTFQFKSQFSTWISTIAFRRFVELKPRFLGLSSDSVPVEQTHLPSPTDNDYEIRERRVMLLDAISRLENGDYKFVILKTLEGYSSEEIAQLLELRWRKHLVVKFNKSNEQIFPTAAYIDVLRQRAKQELKTTLKRYYDHEN